MTPSLGVELILKGAQAFVHVPFLSCYPISIHFGPCTGYTYGANFCSHAKCNTIWTQYEAATSYSTNEVGFSSKPFSTQKALFYNHTVNVKNSYRIWAMASHFSQIFTVQVGCHQTAIWTGEACWEMAGSRGLSESCFKRKTLKAREVLWIPCWLKGKQKHQFFSVKCWRIWYCWRVQQKYQQKKIELH